MADMTWGGNAVNQAIVNWQFSKKQARSAKEQFAKRFQIMRADLERAGLNPLLAFRMDPGIPPSGEPGPMQPFDLGGGIGSAMQGVEAIRNMRSSRDLMRAQTEEAYQRGLQSAATRRLTGKQEHYQDLQNRFFEILNRVPQAQAESNLWSSPVGTALPWARFVFEVEEALRGRRSTGAPRSY